MLPLFSSQKSGSPIGIDLPFVTINASDPAIAKVISVMTSRARFRSVWGISIRTFEPREPFSPIRPNILARSVNSDPA